MIYFKHAVPSALLVLLTSNASAGTLTVPNTFTAGTPAVAADVNANFDAVKLAVDDNNTASRFYGDGSAGAVTISASTTWATVPPTGNNLNFTDFTIDAAVTLTVAAGTTIRCSGNFTNNGTINVLAGVTKTGGSFNTLNDAAYNGINAKEGHPGDTLAPAGAPYWHNDFTANSVAVDGAKGGIGIVRTYAASSFNSFRIGGGSGSGYAVGGGGGLLKIYCQNAITNNGTINANGLNGSSSGGGGGGGIVILASQTSVSNAAGTISATGGNGGSGFSWGGHGGGGGGGIAIFVAPSVTTAGGTITLSGGTAGTSATTTATTNVRIGGGGGGASGGNGGFGGTISAASALGTAGSGSAGYSIEITANPAYMM